jgi:hypothetical protein
MGFPWGLDFGNQNCVIAIARKGGIDVIDNEASSRKVSTWLSPSALPALHAGVALALMSLWLPCAAQVSFISSPEMSAAGVREAQALMTEGYSWHAEAAF